MTEMKKAYHILYVAVVVAIFAGFTIVFDTFPRSTFSELEKRDLATFPEFSWDKLWSGRYSEEISTWFSDSEPYRDNFMALSMEFDEAKRVSFSDDNVKITLAAPMADASVADESAQETQEAMENPLADENGKLANAGIIVVGEGENVRALMIYGGDARGGVAYAEAANQYYQAFGGKVKVYSMTVPLATEFYCPDNVKKHSRPQRPTIDNVHSLLAPGVKAVDVYTPLSRHIDEDIYLRTDHHWAPLGGFYAAEAFAKTAGVPFKSLDSYERKVIKNFVGSMYGYSKDISIKKAPEDFVYYVPKGVNYTTEYVVYDVNKSYQVTRESKPMNGPFFYSFKDGSGAAYSTFMGSDQKITHVKTSTKNGRRLMIIKDSYGNAIPGYLFYSFEDIHVVDARYFTKNMKRYVEAYGITDILFAFNVFNAYSGSLAKKAVRYLSQSDGTVYPVDSEKPTDVDTVSAKKTVVESVSTEEVSPAEAVAEEKPEEKQELTPAESEPEATSSETEVVAE